MNRAAGLAKLGNVFRKILRLSRSFANVWPIDAQQRTVRRVRHSRLRNLHKHLEVRFRPAITRSHAISTAIPITSRPFIIGQPYLSMNLDKLETIRAAGCGANESLWNDNCDRIVPRRRLSAFPTKFCFHEPAFYRLCFFRGSLEESLPSNFR